MFQEGITEIRVLIKEEAKRLKSKGKEKSSL